VLEPSSLATAEQKVNYFDGFLLYYQKSTSEKPISQRQGERLEHQFSIDLQVLIPDYFLRPPPTTRQLKQLASKSANIGGPSTFTRLKLGKRQTFQLYQFRNGQIFEKEMTFKGCTEWTPEDDFEDHQPDQTEGGTVEFGTASFREADMFDGSFKGASRKNSLLNSGLDSASNASSLKEITARVVLRIQLLDNEAEQINELLQHLE
jgi:hypothetical protein